ncbi:NAD(P)H-binding protein [Sphingomonas lacunae]|uniref:NAD(P)H-binding protein n=1 Tax=Sphingomonas lacunae TaxID=2698828 RepID=A0A6M4AW83_9SPHN|nr:NAD(P)H-binding protein [Sphingomonas lacunae]QJQ32610.1 NAD(P)H-binding protein [Sphingomonas lacunae]
MRILIIGATGNSGLALTKGALARGLDTRVYVRSANKIRDLLGADACEQLSIRTGTLADRAALADAMKGADAVVNAAGNATVDADFVSMVQRVIDTAEQVLGANGRLWLFGGAAALDVPGSDLRVADLPFVPKPFKQHIHNHARVAMTSLDWSMLCPGPMVSAADGLPHSALRVSVDCWPVDGPGSPRLFKSLRILKAFKARLPELIVTYEDAAKVILDNLPAHGPYARRRVGLALPPGHVGAKPGMM